jgi:hypothetical protein
MRGRAWEQSSSSSTHTRQTLTHTGVILARDTRTLAVSLCAPAASRTKRQDVDAFYLFFYVRL